MKRQIIRWSVVSVLIMLGLPFIVVLLAGDAGMMLCMLLFFAVNPIYSVVLGWAAGKERNKLWMLPVISPALFLAGAWLFFSMGEIVFAIYALVYLALGTGAMLASGFLRWDHISCK